LLNVRSPVLQAHTISSTESGSERNRTLPYCELSTETAI
jgi:hypothetical protein